MPPTGSYNIALDCIDKNADSLLGKNKPALIFIKASPGGTLQDPPLRLTFATLKSMTNRMANAFRTKGIHRGERILLRLPNGPEFPISFLGAVKAGAIPIPTSPLLTWDELKFLLEDSKAGTLVTTPELLPAPLESSPPVFLKNIYLTAPKGAVLPKGMYRWGEQVKQASPQWETRPTGADDPAFWLYTSGTTGEPKGVIHAHRCIRAHDPRARAWQNLQAGDTAFNTSSLNWSYALTAGLLDLWRHGLTAVVYEGPLSPENLAEILRRFGVTLFMSVPGIYRRLNPHLEAHPESFSGVRVCLSAGEALGKETRDRFHSATNLDIYEGLGMTEHSIYLAQPFGETPVPGSVGRPLPDPWIKILRADLTEAKPGETGILASHRRCEGLMLGYHRSKKEDAARFEGDWFLSGDLAYRDEKGNFFFVGRRDDMITAGGYRLSPLEVEKILNQHPLVVESAVTGKVLSGEKTIVQAFVVLKPHTPASRDTEQQLLTFAGEHLAKYKIPRQIIYLDKLPKTHTGKIKRKEL